MSLINRLTEKWKGVTHPFLIHPFGSITFQELIAQNITFLSEIKQGQVVVLIGDFDPLSIRVLFELIDRKAIVVPLIKETEVDHEYFFDAALADFIIESGIITYRKNEKSNKLINLLRAEGHPGLIAFSSGTSGRPKAILHNFKNFLNRFDTPRPTLRTLNFLMFDHVGGLNTLFHTLFNKGVAIIPKDRSVDSILYSCEKHEVEVLPTTPTFLRMMLMSGLIPEKVPKNLKIITYGSERMDQQTLEELCDLLPHIDFRQTYGTSELGVVRVKSEARKSLFMKIGDFGLETKVVDNILHLRSHNQMIGYLNADSPFDNDGWFNTHDIVEEKNNFYKIVGRDSNVINVGGLKFMASEVERKAIAYKNVLHVKAYAKPNPITGEHVEIIVQPKDYRSFSKLSFKKYLNNSMPSHMAPKKIIVGDVEIGNRFKKI